MLRIGMSGKPAERPGISIGRYRLLHLLGEGGFGSVWHAEQSEPIRRDVALKVIKPGMDSREIIARFEAERQALALMDHPSIAGVLDAGTTEGGRPFFAMELVRGVPITDYCDARQLTIRQRLELFIPVCQAVQHAHQKGILHRDLKPSNILVTEVDGKPVPKVIDFGIAKALGTFPEAVLKDSLLQTQAGAVIGTPQYMSPEQAGAAPDLDTRSDIYTLGIILYELLTGDTPLSRESLCKAALDEVLRLVREADPRRPSSRVLPVTDVVRKTATSRHTEPARLARALAGDLDWITLKALEKERDRRYGTAAALAQDLERHLKNEPVEAGPPSPVYRLRKLVRRNRLAFAAATAITVSLIAGIAMTTWQWRRAEDQKEAQEQLLWNASHSEHESAIDAFDSGNNAEGLAHLVRALEYRPMNEVALAASAAHVFASKPGEWRTRSVMTYEEPVKCLAISPDGNWLAAGVGEYSMRMIETGTGREVRKVVFDDGIQSVAFSPDGRYIAVCGYCTIYIIESESSSQVSKAEFVEDVHAMCFSPDSRMVVVTAGDYKKTGEARVIDAATGKLLSSITLGGEAVSTSFSPDSRLIAVGEGFSLGPGTAWLIEAASGKVLRRTSYSEGVTTIGFSPNGNLMIIGGEDSAARIIETITGREVAISQFDRTVNSACFSPDGRYIAAGVNDNTLRIIEAATGILVSKTVLEHDTKNLSFSPDGRFVVANCGYLQPEGEVRVVETTTGKLVHKDSFSGGVSSGMFSADGRYLAVGSEDKTVRVYDTAVMWNILEVGDGNAASFSPDSRDIASSWKNTMQVVELATGKKIRETQFGGQVNSVSYSPDNPVVS